MNLSLFIAKRYFLSKKKTFINFLSITAFLGVVIGTSALIIVLSVFNGLEALLKSLYGNFDPEIKIVSNHSKYFDDSNVLTDKINNIDGINVLSKVIEDRALVSYNNSEIPIYLKGVDSSFHRQNRLEKNIVEGSFILSKKELEYVVIGRGVKYKISLNIKDNFNNITLYSISPNFSFLPGQIQKNPFNQLQVRASGVFAIEQQLDNNYMISSLNFAKKLFDKKTQITAIELQIDETKKIEEIEQEIQNTIGNQYSVLTIEEQHADLYKILKTEKLIVFIIFGFILIISSFNIFFVLSMLALDKKKDLAVLNSLGINENSIKKIFLFEGFIISFLGVSIGAVLGMLICWAQDRFGLVPLGMETAIIEYYPVEVYTADIIMVITLVFIITILASIKPSQIAIKNISLTELNNK